MKNKLLEKLIKDKTDFCVKVSNDDERDKILSLFASYEDIRWVNGYKPMEIKHCNYPYFICLRNNKTISYYWEKCTQAKEIKFNDLFDNNIYNYKFEDGISFIDKSNKYLVKINLDNYIKK